jgi:hypothetical protein
MTGAGSLSPSPSPSWPCKTALSLSGAQDLVPRKGYAPSAARRVRDGSPKGEDPRSGTSAPAESPARREAHPELDLPESEDIGINDMAAVMRA